MFVVINDLHDFAATILLAVGALLPIVDPLSGAPIYLARRPTSRGKSDAEWRRRLR